MKSRRKSRRGYESALRQRQEEETRALILQAFGEQVRASRAGEFSLPEVAARAGVSVRTLYRHFGSREGLLDALQAHAAAQVTPSLPTSVDELLGLAPTLFATFDAHAPWVEAMVRSGPVSELRAAGKPRRVALFRALTAPLVEGLPQGDAAAVQALIKHLVSAETWLVLRRDFGVDGPTAGRAVARALRALVAQLAEEHRATSPSRRARRKVAAD